jgi:F-type H+-transporting ATPase subunit b
MRTRLNAMSPFHRTAPLVIGGALLLPAAAHAAGGMPQLDFANPLTVSQVVWGVIIFVVLYIVASRVALPKVGEVLEQRAGHIARDLEGAHAAKARADTGMSEAAAATAKARADAQASVNTALEEAKRSAATQAEELNARLDRQLHEAEAQINQARAAAMGALRQVATETAETVVTRLTGGTPDRQRVDSAIGAALSARGIG